MPTPQERIAAGQELRKRGRLSQQQDAALQELERRYGMSAEPAPPSAGKRGGMVEEGTISREDYMSQRGPVNEAAPSAPNGSLVPMSSRAGEGLLGMKPVASKGMIKDVGATQRALVEPQSLNTEKMSRAQSFALGVNDLNPVRLATGDRGHEAAMTQSLKDNPFTTRGGQGASLTAGGGAQLFQKGVMLAPKLVAPAVAARLSGPGVGSQLARYSGRLAALMGLGAADFYAYNAIAEAPNQARETGAPSPTMGQRIDYANSQAFTPAGLVASAIPGAGSLVARPVRAALAGGKNAVQTGLNKVLPNAVPAPRPGVTLSTMLTPADVQQRVAGFAGSLTTMSRTDAEKAIDMLLKRDFDPDEAEKMVRFLDYAGKSEVPETLFQLMPNLRRVDQLTVALGTVGGDAKEALAKVLGVQAQESPAILRNALRKAMGASGEDFYAMQKGIQADQLSAPKEGYAAAYAKEVSDDTWETQILPQLRTKYGREAVADAADYAEGLAGTDPAKLGVARQLAELRDALSSQGATPGKVSTQSLDYIDRMLGDVAEGLKSGSGRREIAKGPKGVQQGIRGNANSGLDVETGLADPRRLSFELKSAEEALTFGRKAFKDGTDIETLLDEFAYEMSKAGKGGADSETVRGALLMGWLRGAEDEISKATNPQSVIRRLYGSERQREKLLAMMPELADDAGSGFKGSNTKDIRALVGGKRDDGREMVGMIDRLKRISGDYNRIIGNSQSAQRAAAVLEESGTGDRINRLFDAVLAPKRAAVDIAKAGINIATKPGIYQPGVNRELGRLLTARGKAQLLSVIDEIRQRAIATGKYKPPGGAPAPAPRTPPSGGGAGPIRSSGLGAGLRGDIAPGAVGGFIGFNQDQEPITADNIGTKARNALIGVGVGVAANRIPVRQAANALAPRSAKVAGQGMPKTPAQAAKFETPGSPEYEAAVAKGLDMSQAGRMARAKEMGFDTGKPVYRGLTRPYDAEKAGRYQMFTSSAADAGEFAGNGSVQGGNVVAAYLRRGNNLSINGGGNNFNSVPVSQLPAEVRRNLHPSIGATARTDEIAEAAQKAGFDSVSIKNVFDNSQGEIPRKPRPAAKDDVDALLAELEAGGFDMSAKGSMQIGPEIPRNYDPVTVDVIFDPSNIRSVNAAFDPDKAASPILTAGLGGGGRGPRKPSGGGIRTAEVGKRAADLAAIGTLANAPPAQAQTADYTAEITAAKERANQIEKQAIPQLEADLRMLEDPAGDPFKLQELLQRRGDYEGKIDGKIGPLTRQAIADNAKRVRQEIETQRNELKLAREAVKQAEIRAAQARAEPSASGDILNKAAWGASFLAGGYLAYRMRNSAALKSIPAAQAATRKANALLNPKPLSRAKTGPDSLNARAGNINDFWRQGGAKRQVPFEADDTGAWRARPNAKQPSEIFGRAPRFRGNDIGFMATAGIDAGASRLAINHFDKEIAQADADIEKFTASGDIAGLERALARKKTAKGAKLAAEVMERLGYGYIAGRSAGALKAPYARVAPNMAKAEAERALLLQAMNRQPKPKPAPAQKKGQGNP